VLAIHYSIYKAPCNPDPSHVFVIGTSEDSARAATAASYRCPGGCLDEAGAHLGTPDSRLLLLLLLLLLLVEKPHLRQQARPRGLCCAWIVYV